MKDYKQLSDKEKKKILSVVTKKANEEQRKIMPIKKEKFLSKERK